MSDLQVLREQRIGYGEHGQDVRSDETYIKVLRTFKAQLKALKGAPLSIFMCIALHEADIMLEDAVPLTLSSIQDITGYSRPTVTATLDDLTERRFIEELPELGYLGEKQYRVCAYSWFGKGDIMLGKKTLHPENNLPRSSLLNTNTRKKTFNEGKSENNFQPQVVTVEDSDGDGLFYCSGCNENHALGEIKGNKLPCGCTAYVPGKKLLSFPDNQASRYLCEMYPHIESVVTERQLKVWVALLCDFKEETIMAMVKWSKTKPFTPGVAIDRVAKAIRKHYSPDGSVVREQEQYGILL